MIVLIDFLKNIWNLERHPPWWYKNDPHSPKAKDCGVATFLRSLHSITKLLNFC